MNDRNWERLLLSTLKECRDHLPGPGYTEETLANADLDGIKRSAAALGIDVDQILAMAEERKE